MAKAIDNSPKADHLMGSLRSMDIPLNQLSLTL